MSEDTATPTNGPVVRKLDRATTYVNLGLTIALIGAAFRFGSAVGAQSDKLDRVPTRDEVKLIAIEVAKPMERERSPT